MAEKKTFEESLAELEQAVEELENGSLTLDQALASFEQGVKHAARCREFLKQAENKVELLLQGPEGEAVVETFEAGEGPD